MTAEIASAVTAAPIGIEVIVPRDDRYHMRTPMLDMIYPRALETTAARSGMPQVKAARVRLNLHEVTPANILHADSRFRSRHFIDDMAVKL